MTSIISNIPWIYLGIAGVLVVAVGTVAATLRAKHAEGREDREARKTALAERQAAHEEQERLKTEEKAAQAEERETARRLEDDTYARSNLGDFIQRFLAAANLQYRRIQNSIESHERAAIRAREEVALLQKEFPKEVNPTRKHMAGLTLRFVLWVIAGLASGLMMFFLVYGITDNFVFGLVAMVFTVAAVETGAYIQNCLNEAKKKAELTSSQYILRTGLMATALAAFIFFTCIGSNIRAEQAAMQELLTLTNTISTLEAKGASRQLSAEEAINLGSKKDKLETISSTIEQETLIYAVLEGVAIPCELYAGMIVPTYLSTRRTRKDYHAALRAERRELEFAQRKRDEGVVLEQATRQNLEDELYRLRIPFAEAQQYMTREVAQLPLTGGEAGGAAVPEVNSFSVRYDANGGTGAVPEDTRVYAGGDEITVLSHPQPTREGFVFVGWGINPEANQPIMAFTANNNTTLYTIWRPVEDVQTPESEPGHNPVSDPETLRPPVDPNNDL